MPEIRQRILENMQKFSRGTVPLRFLASSLATLGYMAAASADT